MKSWLELSSLQSKVLSNNWLGLIRFVDRHLTRVNYPGEMLYVRENRICSAMKHIFLINLLLLLHLPVKNNNNETRLFVIERSRNSDIIYYDLNASDGGKLDTNKPISYYWTKESKGHFKEPLTRIQEDMGYGIRYIQSEYQNNDILRFYFISMRNQVFSLKKDNQGRYSLFTSFGGKELIVKRLFIQFGNKSFWFPKISFVEIFASNPITGETFSRKILP